MFGKIQEKPRLKFWHFQHVLDMYAEGMGITAANRVFGVKMGAVYSWVKKARQAREAQELDHRDLPNSPPRVISCDEM